MKAFISVDMEGMPHIVISGHLTLKGTLQEEARKIATNVTLVAADELHRNGFAEILIADSHGPWSIFLWMIYQNMSKSSEGILDH